ncbi:putative RNA-directed DNA polymerase from transposon X-element [Stylophora pistillata]|uniref:Putative RNA-directed DNA polymerase from transposon X-element n=1 Tax=Stylophora pistillata TaxID=50429 RepID=A0A2B4RJ17_STYPI|nr:putative RNA-directed DNA polymerase from transposon X-element [Stylophora pistillata]
MTWASFLLPRLLISHIRSKLDGISPSHLPSTSEPDLVSEPSDIVLSDFQCQTVEAIRDMITSGKKKSCILDPIPVTLLSACLDPLLPVITNMVNLSLRTGYFADAWKTAVVHPLLKKPGLDLLFKNFRPISNLQFVSKLTERVVANQIQCHMIKNNLFPQLQSAYRSHHSTETALLKVKNDLLINMNKGHVSLLVLLDLSAAFDTVDHKILLKALQTKLGVCGSALSWFKSYLEGRSQRICIKETLSQSFDLKWGVPQGSCLGPLLFTIYSSDLFSLLESHLPTAHAYADDTQLYLSFSPSVGTGELDAVTAIENCIRDIRQWMCVRKLMLNDDKTEFMLVGTRKQLTKVSIDGVRVGDYNISPSSSVCNLGTWFDPHLDMDVHITKTCSSAFYYLYNIRHSRKYLSRSSTETLAHAVITSRLDYCNSLLYGLPKYQLSKLQRVMNASARFVCCAPKSCHITPLLRELHWLPVCYRIEYKIILLTFKVLHGMAPDYLRHSISLLPPSSIHFTMELSNNDSIPFIGTSITKNGNKLETQVYRKPTNTGLLLHFQSHTDLRYKKCLIKTMVHRAKELSSTHQAFVDECRHLKSMFHRLGYPSSLVNFIIDKCDYSSTPDTKTKSVETLRVSIPFKDQISVNIAKRQMRDLSSKIGIDVQPVYTSKKLEQDLKLKEIKPRILNQHSVVYCFKCDLCDSNYVGYTTRHLFQRIADHRYSAIGRHLRDAHGNIDLLNESQFRMLKKCGTKWDCLVYEMLYIRTIRPNLNTQSDSIRAKLFV